jgi:hypothetical protein
VQEGHALPVGKGAQLPGRAAKMVPHGAGKYGGGRKSAVQGNFSNGLVRLNDQ